VSVDHLIGTAAAASPPQLFEHQVLIYGSDDEFLAGAIPFLGEGIEQSSRMLAVTTEPKTALLCDALGERCGFVEFADWADWYRSPQNALRRYGEFVKEQVTAGVVWIRVIAEAAWAGETDADIAEWTRYESLVNLAFASSPATILCTYDERSFSPSVVADAHCTHPEIVRGNDATASVRYQRPEDLLLHCP
jgi:hypothetical protein